MFKSEKGMSRLELVITIAAIMLIAACTIVLSIGEDGLFFLPKNNEIVKNEAENIVNNVDNTEVYNNEINSGNENIVKNEIIPAENKISNEIENIIDDTVYPGQ